MALAPDELKRRIEAARILRGCSQAELGVLFEQDGLGKHDVGRLERGDLAMQRIHLDALCRHLTMPEWWFTDERVVLPERRPPETVLELVDALLTELDADRADALRDWRQNRPSRPGAGESGSQTQGGA